MYLSKIYLNQRSKWNHICQFKLQRTIFLTQVSKIKEKESIIKNLLRLSTKENERKGEERNCLIRQMLLQIREFSQLLSYITSIPKIRNKIKHIENQ